MSDEVLREELRRLREEQTLLRIALEGRLAKIETNQAALLEWRDKASGNALRVVGVMLAALFTAIMAAVLPGGAGK